MQQWRRDACETFKITPPGAPGANRNILFLRGCLELYQLRAEPVAPRGALSPGRPSPCAPLTLANRVSEPRTRRCAGRSQTGPAPLLPTGPPPRARPPTAMNGDARSRRADPPRGSRWAGAGGRERAAGYLRADHVELAIVLQLELDRLLPEGLAQRHHHHCGGGGGRPGPGCEGSGGLRRSRGVPS